MTIGELLAMGGIHTLLGIAVILGILVFLYFVIRAARAPEIPEQGRTVKAVSPVARQPRNNAEIIAAISAAVNVYRKNKQ